MSYVNRWAGDDRAHTTPREKDTQARQIVDYARKLMLADQPAGVEACNECLAQHLMLALIDLSGDIADGKLEFEKRGTARRLAEMADECSALSEDLVASADRDDPRGGDRRPANDILRALLAA